MNAMMFGEKTDTPGGRKLKHSCSLSGKSLINQFEKEYFNAKE